MMHADRHTIGHYRCTADNRVGQPDSRDIFVNVLCKYQIIIDYYYYTIWCTISVSRHKWKSPNENAT